MSTLPAPVLTETKLRPPDPRAGLVARGSLLGRLGAAVDAHALTLVSAAAGWGKTTLVGAWLARSAQPAAWVALDATDNDPARFWRYIAEALRRAGVPVDDQAAAALAGDDEVREAGLTAMLNAMSAGDGRVVLALDDYHAIVDEGIHETMAFLVERLPDPVRLVVTTRADPPFSLARLRARGALAEIRSDDLRFDDAEAESLLNDGVGLALDRGDVSRLRARTEGWAAGLYLAGLSLRGRDDPAAFIREFAGDDRLVVDYLAEEVLGGQTPARRAFLLRTSVLARLTGTLCDAVAGTTGSARVLAELEASNFFLVPLDSRRRWYRYHHLFGELLRHELSLSAPGEVADLHRRAAAWYLAADDVDEAVHHLAAAGEMEGAADLIAERWAGFHASGWTATTQHWLSLLPRERVCADPRLCMAEALILINLGRPEDARPWLDRMEAAMASPDAPGDRRLLESSLAAGRSLERLLSGDGPGAVDQGRTAVGLDPGAAGPWSAVANLALGIALHAVGDMDGARPILEKVVEIGRRAGPLPPVVVSLSHLANQAIDRGDLDEGERLARDGIETAAADRHAEYPHAAGSHAALGRVHAARGRIDEAVGEGERAVRLARRGRSRTETAASVVALAEILAVAGDATGARERLGEARSLLAGARRAVALERSIRRLEDRLAAVPPPRAAPSPGDLTDRELAVLRRLAGDGSLREIAADLFVSHNTVKTQARAVYRKLGAATRQEAVARGRERGLLTAGLTGR